MATPPLPALSTTIASSSKAFGLSHSTPSSAVDSINAEAYNSNRATQVEAMPHFLTLSRLDINQKFQELEWKQRFRLSHANQNPTSSPYLIDKTADILLRNRYGNIQPWAKSRIKLKVPDGHCDYINASPIVLKNALKPASESRYIATQGPKDNQFSHFWNMVMEETADPAIIIMLTQTFEGPREKCAQYFPPSMEEAKLEFSSLQEEAAPNKLDIVVDSKEEIPSEEAQETAENESNAASTETSGSVTLNSIKEPQGSCRYAFRDMTLERSNRTKRVYHYLFPSWADFSKPEAEDRQSLIDVMQDSAQKCGDIATNPRIVHCSAGVGRTGTFIAVDHLLRELGHGTLDSKSAASIIKSVANGNTHAEDKKSDLIFETVNTLRDQRMLMVMNELQYSFIYDVLKEAWEKRHLHGKRKPEPESAPESAKTEVDATEQASSKDLIVDTEHSVPAEGDYSAELEGRSPKIARKTEGDGGIGVDIYLGTKVEEGGPAKDEDTVSSDDEFHEVQESKEEWDKTS